MVLLGTAASDEGCAKLLCETDIILLLIDLLKTHQEDDEIVLQIVYVFFVSLSHESVIEYIISKTGEESMKFFSITVIMGKACDNQIKLIYSI